MRERIKIEQRLAQAQEKLVVTEKQALIAELAGTTAHELNQPLTSVMGYSELLKKKMSPEDAHYRAVDIILREAERMAEIVRKIGRITRYETKAYVGSTQILDLDKSAGEVKAERARRACETAMAERDPIEGAAPRASGAAGARRRRRRSCRSRSSWPSELSLELREEELVGTFAATLGALLPGRYLCLRVVDPRTLALTSMIADGPLAAGGRR